MPRKILSVAMMMVMCVATITAAPVGAIVYTRGNVTVNGTPVQHSTSLFGGDKLQTGADATANIGNQGTTVFLGPQSSLVYGDNVLQFGCGHATVTTFRQFRIEVNGLQVAPTGPRSTRFQIVHGGGVLRLSALEGSITINAPREATVLDPGRSAELPSSASCPMAPPALAPTASRLNAPPPPASAGRNWLPPILLVGGGGGALATVFLSGGEEALSNVPP